jgi:hypothetical protein
MARWIFTFLIFLSINLFGAQKEDYSFFEQKIRPILSSNCYRCHSKTAEKIKGGLLLDTKDGLIKGGDTGPAIVPNDLSKSLILKALSYKDNSLQMPPNEKLPDYVLADFEKWIKNGAPDPRSGTNLIFSVVEDRKNHWAYQPVPDAQIPKVKSSRWISNPIDNFILKELEEKNLRPSLSAPKEVLIRRLYFDLLGIPPTYEEVESFVKNKSPKAYENLVDELLKSPLYGERWARHWLDVARYADTSGSIRANTEGRYTYSYTYRDYVISSFNEDKPFNEFVIEQLAADLYKPNDKKSLAALGFLTLGKNSNNNNDVIDDRIDVITKGFLGSTVVCARCHDHKFDAITIKDYYALHGILNSCTIPEEKPIISESRFPNLFPDYVAQKSKIEKEVEDFITKRYNEAFLSFITNTSKWLYGNYLLDLVKQDGKQDFIRTNSLNPRMIKKWTDAMRTTKKQEIEASIYSPYLKAIKITNDFRVEFKKYIEENEKTIHSYIFRYTKNANTLLEVCNGYQAAVLDSQKRYQKSSDSEEKKFYEIIFENSGPLEFTRENFARFLSDNNQTMRYDNDLRREKGKLVTLELSHPAATPRAMAIYDKPTAQNSPVFIKGDPNSRGSIVPRRFLEVLSPTNNIYTNGSGRLELAKSIADPKNPLTSRVYVNRLWQHHFGVGLVNSPDDFGTQSEKPKHLNLLNWLANDFIKHGWSTKYVHKLIVMSSTYQQSSKNNTKYAIQDQENSLYWKMNMIRLDFESMRDSLLMVSRRLDFVGGGQSVDLMRPDVYKRSVYGLIDRGRLPDLFTTFDMATPEMPTGKRFSTIVPKQALFLMNGDLVIQSSVAITSSKDFEALKTDKEKIIYLYKIVYQRLPAELEIKLGTAFVNEPLKDFKNKLNAWTKYSQTLLLGNEFVFIN